MSVWFWVLIVWVVLDLYRVCMIQKRVNAVADRIDRLLDT